MLVQVWKARNYHAKEGMDVVLVEFFIHVWVLLFSRLRTHTVRTVSGLFSGHR
jgi:hypothetical protein